MKFIISGGPELVVVTVAAASASAVESTNNAAVINSLTELIERDGSPLVVKLPRTPGRKDAEYMHLFSGPIDIEAHVSQTQTATDTRASESGDVSELAERVSKLEAEVAMLKEQLKTSS